MPSKVLILNFIGIILQYSLVVLLYYFLFRVLRAAYLDFNPAPARREEFPAVQPQTAAALETGRLVVVAAGTVNMSQTVFAMGESITIGRGEENEVVISDTFVSHEHACITRYKHGFWLADLHSTNGTYLNNKRITEEVQLDNGDVITIGAVTFRFER